MDFEMTLDADITEAVFDTGQMLWLGTEYMIEYLDAAGETVLTKKANGKYYNGNGQEVSSLNDIVSGSENGGSSYRTSIVQQRLSGKVTVHDDKNLLAANTTLSAAVQVLGHINGKTLQPVFRAWFEGNEGELRFGKYTGGE